jgi:hypothetical protein
MLATLSLVDDLEASSIAGGEDLGFAVLAAFPDRTHRVDHMTNRRIQVKRRRRHRIPGLARTDHTTGLGQAVSSRTVDGAIDAAPAQQ